MDSSHNRGHSGVHTDLPNLPGGRVCRQLHGGNMANRLYTAGNWQSHSQPSGQFNLHARYPLHSRPRQAEGIATRWL